MQLDHLKYLALTVERGSMSKAAEALNCTQPAITSAIKGIERELGAPVIYRTSTGIIATPLGERVISDSYLMSGYMENWKRIAHGDTEDDIVNIVIYGTPPSLDLMRFILRFKKGHKDIKIELRHQPYEYSSNILNIDNSHRIMIAYKIPNHLKELKSYAADRGLQTAIMSRENFYLYGNFENAIMQKDLIYSSDLKGERIILHQNPQWFPYYETIKKMGCDISSTYNEEENLINSMTLDCEPLSFRPSGLTDVYFNSSVGSIIAKPVADLSMPVYVCAFYPTDKNITPNEKLFMEAFENHCPSFEIV